LDFDIDGVANTVFECDAEAADPGPDNPWGNAWRSVATRLDTEQQAIRDIDPARSRVWKIVNPQRRNRLGQPVGYKLVPGPTPTPTSWSGTASVSPTSSGRKTGR